jgi:hypothetical protein
MPFWTHSENRWLFRQFASGPGIGTLHAAQLVIRRQGMLDNSAMLDNRGVLRDNTVPMLDNGAALDNIFISAILGFQVITVA